MDSALVQSDAGKSDVIRSDTGQSENADKLQNNTSEDKSDNTEPISGITLEKIRKACEDSGFTVYDQQNLVFLNEIKDGFSVEITADNNTTVYSFVECNSEEANIKNAKDIDDAGYSIAIRNGRFLSCYSVDNKDGVIRDILSSLIEGKAVDKSLYESYNSSQIINTEDGAEQTDNDTTAVLSNESVSEPITGTWGSAGVSGSYNSESDSFDEISGMGVLYDFRDDGSFSQLIAFGTYTVTTGKYSIDEGRLTLTDRISVESSDYGLSWSEEEALPDASCYYEIGSDDSGKYLLLGQEDAYLPLEAAVNAMKFSLKE